MDIKDKRVAELTGLELAELVRELEAQEGCYVRLEFIADQRPGQQTRSGLVLWTAELAEYIRVDGQVLWGSVLATLAARKAELASGAANVAEAQKLLEGTDYEVVKKG